MRVAPAICDAGPEGSNVGRMFVWHAIQILPNAAYLQRSFRTGASLHNHQYWQQFGNSRGTKFPPFQDGHGAKISSAVWLFRTRGPRQRPVCVMRQVEGWYCQEETCSGTGRAAFAPDRWLHQHAPAADGDEGVMTGLLEWGVGGGPVIGPAPFLLSIAAWLLSLPRIPR